MSFQTYLACCLGLTMVAAPVATANPLPPFAEARMQLAYETVSVKISGQDALVSGKYKFNIPKGVYSGLLLYLPVYGSPDANEKSFMARVITDEGPRHMYATKGNPLSSYEGEHVMPALEGQEVTWMKCVLSLPEIKNGAHAVEYTIRYRQKLSQGRFIYTPLIPNMMLDHDYGTITIESEDVLKLLDEDKHSFELKDDWIVVKPSHMGAIIVESYGPRRAWEIGKEFREELATTQKHHHDFCIEFADKLSDQDVVLFCHYGDHRDLRSETYLRWGSIDHKAALAHAMKLEDKFLVQLVFQEDGEWHNRRLKNEDLNDLAQEMAYEVLRQVIKGWVQAQPKAAWSACKNREGVFSQSKSVAAFPYDLAELIFAELARVDATYAFEELVQVPGVARQGHAEDPFKMPLQEALDDNHLGELLEHRLKGYCAGAPDGQNWAEHVKRILSHELLSHGLKREVSVSLMGRWLNDAPDEAWRWFESGSVKDLHWYFHEERDPFFRRGKIPGDELTKVRHHMGHAIGYWASINFSDAWKWVGEKYPSKPDVFGFSFHRGYQWGAGDSWEKNEIDRLLAMEVSKLPEGQRIEFVKSVWIPVWEWRSARRAEDNSRNIEHYERYATKYNKHLYEKTIVKMEEAYAHEKEAYEQHVAGCLKSINVDGGIWSSNIDAE